MTGLLIGITVIVVMIVIGLRYSETNWGGAHVNWLDGWVRLLCRIWHRQSALKLALPETGPAIVVANHVSGLDPLLLITATQRPLRFLIASEEYHRPFLHWIFKAAGCIPVDRRGRPEKALRQARRALEQGEVLALFPHGKIHLDSDPPRRIKGGVIRLAAWTDAPVYPVRIDGVRLQGSVLFAPFVPGHVVLQPAAKLKMQGIDAAEALQTITLAIETPIQTKAS